MNQTIRLGKIPERIVSLVPSQTELLYDLGLGDRVIGITKFCIHPNEWYQTKKRVGGTKTLHLEEIANLNPDLILGNKEENTESDIRWLANRFPVYMSDIFTVEDALQMIADVGVLVDEKTKSGEFIERIKKDFATIPEMNGRVAYFIWDNPYMLAGKNTFIGDLIQKLGLQNILSDPNIRYAEISEEELKQVKPDFVFLSSEPFPFKEEHRQRIQTLLSSSNVLLVDGEMFSWYGSRMTEMKKYFSDLAKRLR